MSFNFGGLKVTPESPRPIDPLELFRSLKVTDPMINDLWLAQGDALRAWHTSRSKKDICVQLNTGAGKTLVGLLVAQSLVNETRSLVLYVCSSIQLVKQTEQKAGGYGLPATTYISGDFSNSLALGGEAPCLTTYQALFNGRSVFARRDVAAVIFDDAHVAEHLLRDAFTVNLERSTFPDLVNQLLAMFEEYFFAVDRSATFLEIKDKVASRMLLVPPSEVKRRYAEVLGLLRESTVATDPSTLFAWEHLRDHIDVCTFLISGSAVTITPPFIPSSTLPYFDNSKRRIYLSATLSAEDVFARTFGRKPEETISPTTTAGECERMILIPRAMDAVPKDEIKLVEAAIATYKTLVLVPTYNRAGVWKQTVKPPAKDEVAQAVDEFKQLKGHPKLLLTNRYDGVDLPGDMCRMLVVDELPSSTGPLDRYLWEFLHLEGTYRSAVACRFTQSLGRISRGMSDHGVVFVTGKGLFDWLRIPKNWMALPIFVQKQLELGRQISKSMTEAQLTGAPQACIDRDPGWLKAYSENMNILSGESPGGDMVRSTKLALAEARYAKQIWSRDYIAAARALQDTLEDASDLSTGTVGWHCLWIGYALDLAGDEAGAAQMYGRAGGCSLHLPRIRPRSGRIRHDVSAQVAAMAGLFGVGPTGSVEAPTNLFGGLSWVSSTATPAQVETGLRWLGHYLGLSSSRPDNDVGTGPDNLWLGSDGLALCIEAKTDKEADSLYFKKEMGQLADHVQWVKGNHEPTSIIPLFVGPMNRAANDANPSPDVLVGDLAEFESLAQKLKALYQDAGANAVMTTLESYLAQELPKRGLEWPSLIGGLNLRPISDL